MTWTDTLVDGVDVIDATRWNAMTTDQQNRSISTHTHTEFQLYPQSFSWYIYLSAGTYYVKNMQTGAIDTSNSDFATVLNYCITNSNTVGFIKLGYGTFVLKSAISCGIKPIVIEGMGWGKDAITSNPGTLLKTDTSGAYMMMKWGANGNIIENSGIRNCAIMLDASNTTSTGALDFLNSINCFVENCYIYGFNGASMNSVTFRGNTAETLGGWNNRAMFNHIINPGGIGIYLGPNANYCTIQGNNIESDAATTSSVGIKCDGPSAPIASPYGCIFIGNKIKGFNNNSTSYGIYVGASSDNSGRHTFIGNHFTGNANNIYIASGTGIGDCTITANYIGSSATSQINDNSNVATRYFHNKNYVTDNWGTSTGTGAMQTIAHGLAKTPLTVVLTPTVSVVSLFYLSQVSDATNIYPFVGSGKTYLWRAWV